MKRCGIDLETLADVRDGRAEPATAERVQTHLAAGCAACEQQLQWLETTTSALREVAQVTVPEAALARAHALFLTRFPQPAPLTERIAERISTLARLVFDSRQTPALAGARGSATASFQLIFSTDALDVELWQDPLADGSWYLIGQALPKASEEDIVPEAVTLTPIEIEGEALTVVPNAAEFHLRSVPPGLYRMTLRLADSDVLLPDVRIG